MCPQLNKEEIICRESNGYYTGRKSRWGSDICMAPLLKKNVFGSWFEGLISLCDSCLFHHCSYIKCKLYSIWTHCTYIPYLPCAWRIENVAFQPSFAHFVRSCSDFISNRCCFNLQANFLCCIRYVLQVVAFVTPAGEQVPLSFKFS